MSERKEQKAAHMAWLDSVDTVNSNATTRPVSFDDIEPAPERYREPGTERYETSFGFPTIFTQSSDSY